jgi:DNA-3-methyladenine glycosylase II
VTAAPYRTPVPGEAIDFLRSADPVMSSLVERIGAIEYDVQPDLWRALVDSVIGQQLSVRAAATIRGRVAALGGEAFPSPAILLGMDEEALRGAGLSRAKLSYLRDIASKWAAGEIRPIEVADASDEEVIATLVRMRGVGRWTAEMVLIFSLARPDVLAVDDLGIRVAAEKAYGLPERPSSSELRRLGEAWRPYRSYASLYLWRSLAT